MPLTECSDYSLPKALDISNGDETEGESVCSLEKSVRWRKRVLETLTLH